MDTKAVEQWVLSWRRRLLSIGWVGLAVGRAVGLTAGGRAGGSGFQLASSEWPLAAGSVEYWVPSWRRSLCITGCSLGHESC